VDGSGFVDQEFSSLTDAISPDSFASTASQIDFHTNQSVGIDFTEAMGSMSSSPFSQIDMMAYQQQLHPFSDNAFTFQEYQDIFHL